MSRVSAYRKISSVGSSYAVFVTTLLKGMDIKPGDIVKVTIDVPDKEEGSNNGSDNRDSP